jgi:hypothetical protein
MLLKNAENNKDHYFIIYPINSKMKNGRREEKNNDILRTFQLVHGAKCYTGGGNKGTG